MTDPITDLSAAVRAEGALPVPAGSVRLTAEREAEIRERAPKRTAEFTAWLNAYSPLPGGDAADHAEAVLEEDFPALLAELDAVRAERDQARAALRGAADQIAELESDLAGAVVVSEALHRRLTEEQLAGSALHAALTMPTTPAQRQAALDKFTAVAQQEVFGPEATS